MKRTILTAAATSLATAAAALALTAPAHAVTPLYNYVADAGATQVNAIGLTVQSNATAESRVAGFNDASATNAIASASAGTLLVAGAATTDSSATLNSAGGVTVVAHARTTGLSLLGGLIKAKAIDSTATIVADGTNAPTTSMTTSLVGLTIGGKAYPATVNPNTGITIPGVVSIALNAQVSGTSGDSAVVFGAGLRVTLLAARNGTTAGAIVAVNPLVDIIEPGNSPEQPGYALGGAAYGSYVHANVGSSVQVMSGRTASVTMPNAGTYGNEQVNSTARAALANVLSLGAIQSSETGVRSDALSVATETASVGSVNLFNGLITAKAVSATSTASVSPDSSSVSGGLTFVSLSIAGKAIPVNVAPNTSIHVANLGTVTINEQKSVVNPGVVHAYRTIGLHIVLDTARAGLPVGAEVELATAQAEVWH
ncbi:MAG TPA: choice-of-anchor P family protein [Nocardioides sp.]|nr:choice-of-anchor P family protein [Nocardioides sp.]